MATTSLLRSRLTRQEVTGRSPQPVTVTVARVVRPDRRQAFERWAAETLDLAAGFPGNLGGTLLRPGPDGSEYHLVYRFRDAEALAFWERSAERHAALERVRELIEEERYARAVGLQSFFTVPPKPGPRWRMTVLTVVAVFALTSFWQLAVLPLVGGWPWPLRLLVSAVFVVMLLGYVVMPALTRLCARWLRPRA